METMKNIHDKTLADKRIEWLNKKHHPLTKEQTMKLLTIVRYELKHKFNSKESKELHDNIDNFVR